MEQNRFYNSEEIESMRQRGGTLLRSRVQRYRRRSLPIPCPGRMNRSNTPANSLCEQYFAEWNHTIIELYLTDRMGSSDRIRSCLELAAFSCLEQAAFSCSEQATFSCIVQAVNLDVQSRQLTSVVDHTVNLSC